MTVLLDTHLLLWWLANDSSVSVSARRIVSNGSNRVFVSAASAWEIAIKRALGKLRAPANLEVAVEQSHFETLPITLRHAAAAGSLPAHHGDPFDRMLVAQAQVEGMTLMTHDRRLTQYGEFVKLV